MKCPHCLESFHEQLQHADIGIINDKTWYAQYQACPACKRSIILLGFVSSKDRTYSIRLVEPKSISRGPIPTEVPEVFANDYKEACLILADSPKASAALGRRCLQNILREKAGVKKSDLSKEIDQVIGSKQLPSHLSESIDAVRNIGNFAAHPLKSTNTGEIVDVEAGEAEWTLDVLEGLFDFYFVQPELIAKKKEALNKKLQEAGKPPMK
jgi:hypothetical protein